ncbi:MAG: hypothetical protein RLZZ387_1311 [Chloroflexota bacterium]
MSDILPHRNSYRVTPNLIAGEYPGSGDRAAARARVERHLDAGITYFLDLTEEGELMPYVDLLEQATKARQIVATHHRMPIRDVSVPRSPGAMIAILDALDAAIAASHTVYVHCWGGIGRTGTVVGCWLVRHGQSGDEALARIAHHWQGVEKSWRRPRSPETDEQHAYVRAWRE